MIKGGRRIYTYGPVAGFSSSEFEEYLFSEERELEEPDPETDAKMREAIHYRRELTEEQKAYFHWEEVLATFRELPAHTHVGQKYLAQWARKQLKEGWKRGDEVPDLTAFRVEYGPEKIYQITGEPVKTLYVYWYSENHADIRSKLLNEYGYNGFWVYVDAITGYQSELQQRDSVTKYYLSHGISEKDISNLLLYVEMKQIRTGYAPEEVLKFGLDSAVFRRTVEKVQVSLFGNAFRYREDAGYGLYTPQTKAAVEKAIRNYVKTESLKPLGPGFVAEQLAAMSQADRYAISRLMTTDAAYVYTLYRDVLDEPPRSRSIPQKYEKYEQAANQKFGSVDKFESYLEEIQNVFQRRALQLARNMMNNTRKLIEYELNGYINNPAKLRDLAVKLIPAEHNYETYLNERWQADDWADVSEQMESYSFKGMLNDYDYQAMNSVYNAEGEAARVSGGGHPMIAYYSDPKHRDQFGNLLGLHYVHPKMPTTTWDVTTGTFKTEAPPKKNPYFNYRYQQLEMLQGKTPQGKLADGITDQRLAAIRNELIRAGNEIKSAIATTLSNLKEDPASVWELDNLMRFTITEMKLKEGSVPYKVIQSRIQHVQRVKMIKDIFLAVVNIGLGILAASGVGLPLAILAGLGSATISAYQYQEHLKDFRFQQAAANTGFTSQSSLLSVEPEEMWLVLDLLGFGLDAFAVLKIVANVGRMARIFRTGAGATEIEKEFVRQLDRSVREVVLDPKQADYVLSEMAKNIDDPQYLGHIREFDPGNLRIKNADDLDELTVKYGTEWKKKPEGLEEPLAEADEVGKTENHFDSTGASEKADLIKSEAAGIEELYKDSRGIYGYLPGKNSRYYKMHDKFMDAEWVAVQRAIRKEYLNQSKRLQNDIDIMRSQKKSPEEIATYVTEQRNLQKLEARKFMDQDEVRVLEEGNMQRYGNPVGPTVDELYEKYGDWEKIIESSMRKDPEINKLLGLE